MWFPTALCIVTLLAADTIAAPTLAEKGCAFGGNSYKNLELFLHPNGCAELQCQFGKIEVIYGKCGKDINGKCNPVGVKFTANSAIYTCQQSGQGAELKFNNVLTTPAFKSCTSQGRVFKHLDIVDTPDVCQTYQCQDGQVNIIREACSDGSHCYGVNERFVFNSKYYSCNRRSESGSYKNVVMEPQPDKTNWACIVGERRFEELDKFNSSDNCRTMQCQSGSVETIYAGCKFWRDSSCRTPNEAWEFQGQSYHCIEVEENGKPKYITEPTSKVFAGCYVGETYLENEEILEVDEGCKARQCQDGNSVFLKTGCSTKDKCIDENAMWVDENGFVQTCRIDANGWHIVNVDSETGEWEIPPPKEEEEWPVVEQQCPKPYVDINFVLDSSASIGKVNYAKQLTFVRKLTETFAIGADDVRVGEIIFSANAQQIFGLGDYNTKDELATAVAGTPYLGNITETAKALDLVLNQRLFSTEKGGRDGAGDLLILMTDGVSENSEETIAAANRLKAKGVKIFTIGIGVISDYELNGVASNPKYVFKSPSFTVIGTLLEDVSRIACDAGEDPEVKPPPPTVVPCRDQSPLDVILLLDSSGSLGAVDYQNELNFAANLISGYQVPDLVRVGALLFSSTVELLFQLDEFSDINLVTSTIKQAQYLKGSTATFLAFETIKRQELFSVAKGGRAGVEKLVIVITDGQSNRPSRTLRAADVLRADGVNIISIGIGNANEDELLGMAGTSSNVFSATNFETVGYIYEQVARRTCSGPSDQEKEICTRDSCEQICLNEENRARCLCREGYTINGADNTQCDDIDECESSNPCEQLCVNSPGAYECACKTGYIVSDADSTACEAVNYCEGSPCEHFCTSEETKFVCSCKEGFRPGAEDSTRCEDIDECAENSDNCEQECDNTEGSFKCHCRAGYDISSSDPSKCKDVDECAENSPCQQVCNNSPGSYDCSCKKGYIPSESDPNGCVDVDECADNTDNCEQECENREGGFKCSCRAGYRVNPVESNKCDDIDECAEDNPCNQICKNSPGSFECSCGEGHTMSASDPTACEAINACESNPCEQICTNEGASFSCSCREGYQINSEDNTKCDDIDECEGAVCQQICTNSPGSFECSCRKGYRPNDDAPAACDDVDECSESPSPCQQICNNKEGSYTCACNDGFVLNAEDPSKCDEIQVCHLLADIVFVIDSSGSIGADNFNVQKTFIRKMVQHFPIGPEDVRFGAVLFSNSAQKEFDLKDYNDEASILAAVDKFVWMKGLTYTNKALDLISSENMFSTANGGRDAAKDILIFITDGASTRPDLTKAAAEKMHQNIELSISVGIGPGVSDEELIILSSDPALVFKAENFDLLAYIESLVADAACGKLGG